MGTEPCVCGSNIYNVVYVDNGDSPACRIFWRGCKFNQALVVGNRAVCAVDDDIFAVGCRFCRNGQY